MRYEIRIDADLPADTLREAFPELEPKVQAAHTVLSGPVVDEAQLYRLLVRFQELGLTITEFCRLPD